MTTPCLQLTSPSVESSILCLTHKLQLQVAKIVEICFLFYVTRGLIVKILCYILQMCQNYTQCSTHVHVNLTFPTASKYVCLCCWGVGCLLLFFLLTELFTETLQARWIIEKTAERKTCQSKEGRSGEINSCCRGNYNEVFLKVVSVF